MFSIFQDHFEKFPNFERIISDDDSLKQDKNPYSWH